MSGSATKPMNTAIPVQLDETSFRAICLAVSFDAEKRATLQDWIPESLQLHPHGPVHRNAVEDAPHRQDSGRQGGDPLHTCL